MAAGKAKALMLLNLVKKIAGNTVTIRKVECSGVAAV
jgi:hypothetical protein